MLGLCVNKQLLQNYFNISCFYHTLYDSWYRIHRILLITNYTRYKRIWYGMFQSQFTLNRFFATLLILISFGYHNVNTFHSLIWEVVSFYLFLSHEKHKVKTKNILWITIQNFEFRNWLSLLLTTLTTNLTRTCT